MFIAINKNEVQKGFICLPKMLKLKHKYYCLNSKNNKKYFIRKQIKKMYGRLKE